VRLAGGSIMIQHPAAAEFPDMPNAAVDFGRADLLMTPARIAEALTILAEAGAVSTRLRRITRLWSIM
jgi:hypothetical protein